MPQDVLEWLPPEHLVLEGDVAEVGGELRGSPLARRVVLQQSENPVSSELGSLLTSTGQ